MSERLEKAHKLTKKLPDKLFEKKTSLKIIDLPYGKDSVGKSKSIYREEVFDIGSEKSGRSKER